MDVTTLSNGVGGYSDADVAKSNVIPIRTSKAESSVAPRQAEALPDRFTLSSRAAEAEDGIADTVNVSSAAGAATGDMGRAARVAGVIAAVQSGTYRVDAKSVANALLSRMLDRSAGSDDETPREQV